MLDLSLRAEVSDAAAQALKDEVRAACPQTTTCSGVARGVAGCVCYPEFSARLWLQTGAFPRAEVSRVDLADVTYKDSDSQVSVQKFLESPDRASAGGWSAVVHGDRGSGKTALATLLAKSIMRWETLRYTTRTRSIYYPFVDYRSMCDRTEKSYSREAEKEYLSESMHSSVVVWDDVTPHGALYPRLLSDVKARRAAQKISVIILSDPIDSYDSTDLGSLLGIQRGRVFAHAWTAIGLNGRILTGAGWV